MEAARSPVSPSLAPRRLYWFLDEWTFPLALVALYAAVVVMALPEEVVQDSWLTLAAGREVVQHGLPAHDELTVWTHGARWVDQQWLAQIVFYGLFLVGGLKLLLATHVTALVGAFASALVAARRRGGSERSVLLVALVCMLLAPWELQIRAQTFAVPLFVWLLWLLVADGRAPSRRVFLVLPILVIWANLHGTAILGALLVVLYGLTAALSKPRGRANIRRWRLRNAALVILSPACLVASPYGLSLVGYYRRMLSNPLLTSYLDEWRATTPSQKTALFFLVAFVAVWLVARNGRRLSLFEKATLLITMVGGLLAIRSVVWFALASLVLLPSVLDGELRERSPSERLRPVRVVLGFAAPGALLLTAGIALARPTGAYLRSWPGQASAAIRRAAAANPGTRILADDRYADWILWAEPELRAQVAYDVRFELFNAQEFHKLVSYQNQEGAHWQDATSGYRVIVVDRTAHPGLLPALLASRGTRILYRDRSIAVIERPPGTPTRH